MAISRQIPIRTSTGKSTIISGLNVLRLFDFHGGINTSVDPSMILDYETPYAINCYAKDSGAVETREGYDAVTDSSLGATKMLGGHKMYTAAGGEYVLWAHGGNIYLNIATSSFKTILTLSRDTNVVTVNTATAHGMTTGDTVRIYGALNTAFDGTFTLLSGSGTSFTYSQAGTNASTTGGKAIKAIKIGLSTTNNYDFCQIVLGGTEYTVISDRAGNLQKFDGTSVTQLVARNGKFPVWHKERLFVIDATDKNTLYASVTLNPSDFTTLVNSSSTDPYNVSIGKGDGDQVMWLGVVNDNITALKRNNIYVLYSSDDSDSASLEQAPSGVGCVSSDGVGKYKGVIYFPSEDGVYAFDGSLSYKVSKRIQSEYDNIANKDGIVGVCFGGWYYMSYTVAGGTYNTEVLAYDIDNQAWWKFTNMGPNCFIPFINGDDDEALYFGSSTTGIVYQMFTGTNDNGSAIQAELRTKYLDMGLPERKKRHRRIYPHFKTNSASTQFGYDHDFNNGPIYSTISTTGGTSLWGTFKWGVDKLGTPGLLTERVPITGQARYTQFRVKNYNLDEKFQFLGISDFWNPRRPI